MREFLVCLSLLIACAAAGVVLLQIPEKDWKTKAGGAICLVVFIGLALQLLQAGIIYFQDQQSARQSVRERKEDKEFQVNVGKKTDDIASITKTHSAESKVRDEALLKATREESATIRQELDAMKRSSNTEVVRQRSPVLEPLVLGKRPKAIWTIENHSTAALEFVGMSGALGFQDPYRDFETNLMRSKRIAWSGRQPLLPAEMPEGDYRAHLLSVADDHTKKLLESNNNVIAGWVSNVKLQPGAAIVYQLESRDVFDETVKRWLESGEQELFTTLVIAYRDSQGWPRFSSVCAVYDDRKGVFLQYQPEKNIVAAPLSLEEIKLPESPSLEFEHGGKIDEFEAGKPFGCYMGFSNNGQSQAQLTRLAWNVAIYPESKIDDAVKAGTLTLPYWTEPRAEDKDVASLDQYSLRVAFVPSLEMVKNVRAGWKVYYYGRIEYRDEKGAQFSTNFCIEFDGGNAFRAHGPFNKSGRLLPLERLNEKTETRGAAMFEESGTQATLKEVVPQLGTAGRGSDGER